MKAFLDYFSVPHTVVEVDPMMKVCGNGGCSRSAIRCAPTDQATTTALVAFVPDMQLGMGEEGPNPGAPWSGTVRVHVLCTAKGVVGIPLQGFGTALDNFVSV